MLTELIVVLPSHNASLDLLDDLPVSLNFAIADVKDPSKRNGAFSKSVKLPGSSNNNTFFEHTYDVNIVTNKFNPNLKTPCYVLQDSIEIFRGYLRLRSIEVEQENDIQKINYEVTLLGDNTTLFGLIGDYKLQDLDVSEYNHVYNRVNQKASWLSSLGDGYVYPLIDYGYNNFLTNSFNVEHLRPAFYVKTYIDKIFAAAGKTYTSSFFNSIFFKRWIIPHNGERFTMSASNLALYEFYAGDTGTSTANTKNLSQISGEWFSGDIFTSTSNTYLMKYNDDTTIPFVDTGNVYDPTTGIFTASQSGIYNINYKTDFEIKFSAVPAGTATINLSSQAKFPIGYKVLRSTDGGSTWNIVLNDTPNYQTSVITTSYQTFTKAFTYSGSLNAGDQIKLLVHPLYSNAGGYGIVFKDGGGTPITVGTATMDWRLRSSATVKTSLSVGDYVSGQNLVINDAIPRDIKQKDFLMSVIRAARLFVSPDPNDTNNYIVQTRNEFYSSGTTVDWTDPNDNKLAINMPQTISFPAEIDVKNFIYRYKSDSDYYNKKYEDANSEPYGSYKKVIANDFTLKDDITELIFSPTMIVDNTNNSMIIPKIFSYDGTVVKPQKHNIRLLMYNGQKTIASGTWNYVAPVADVLGTATLSMSVYPQSAMVDDPLNPTVSIEFGVPNEVFYSPETYTTNNIFNREYSQEIEELTDRDSRIVTEYFYLNPLDISKFDFRNKFFVKDNYFFANMISDYNKLKPGLSKVELLKIKNASAYVPVSSIAIREITTNSTGIGITARYAGTEPTTTNVGSADNILLGDNNSSRSTGSYISGSRNTVSEGSLRVTVIGSDGNNIADNCEAITLTGCMNCSVGSRCTNITLINCVNVIVLEDITNFTGTNLEGVTISGGIGGAPDYNNTSRMGTPCTFSDGTTH